jgi:hypothetical protein
MVLRADNCDGSQKSNTQALIYAHGYQKPKTQFCYMTGVLIASGGFGQISSFLFLPF